MIKRKYLQKLVYKFRQQTGVRLRKKQEKEIYITSVLISTKASVLISPRITDGFV